MSEPPNVIELIVAIIAASSLFSVFFCFRSVRINRKTLKQRVSKLREEYRFDEMTKALDLMGKFKKETSEEAVRAYLESPVMEQKKNHYRRKVAHFFNEVADLYADPFLWPKKLLFNEWSKDDLDIIPKAIIPIENHIRREHGKDELPKDNNLWKLYKDAKEYA